MNRVQLKSLEVKLSAGDMIPVEMHRVRVVQKICLLPVQERKAAMVAAGCNTFLLKSPSIFLDMLTDSGTNAMSDAQMAAMMVADDAYAGSASFTRLEEAARLAFNQEYVLPVHQGRAAEHIIAQVFVRQGQVAPMNYHFTTTKAHIDLAGGKVLELYGPEALQPTSSNPFKGNMDLGRLQAAITEHGPANVAFIRMEASTNLIGGQPFSMANLRDVRRMADKYGLLIVMDASLIGENAYFIQHREAGFADRSIQSIMHEMTGLCDVTYMSARKSSSSRGGMIMSNNKDLIAQIRDLVPLFEGFLTYGGMSSKEIEAIAVGLNELVEEDVCGSTPSMVEFIVNLLVKEGVPVITPAGALGCHVNAMEFLSHVPQSQYPAGALASAFFIASGVRGMERGTISMDRSAEGADVMADLELLRLAVPRRAFTVSQLIYTADRLKWLYQHRELIGGLRWVEEPKVLRFFFGRLEPVSDWPERLAAAYQADFGDL